jgi:hypothetical protein
LAQAELDAIGVSTAMRQGLLYRLGHQVGRVVAMELQDADELPYASSIGPLSPQTIQ